MSETAAEKKARIDSTERDHSAEHPPVAFADAVTLSQLTPGDTTEPFGVKLAHPSKWYSPRGTTPTSVVIHCTAATNPASSTAAFFASSSPSGSAQAVADDIEGYTMVPDDAVCAGAPPFNQEGLHIEQPGLTTWTRATWLSHDAQLRRVAYHVRQWCLKYDIPMRLLSAADLGSLGEKARGITYHAAVSEAFHASTHTDPQPNYPWDVFMSYVTEEDDVTTPAEKAQLERFEKYLDALTKTLGQTGDPAKPATAEGAGTRVGRQTLAAEKGAPGEVPTHEHKVTGTAK